MKNEKSKSFIKGSRNEGNSQMKQHFTQNKLSLHQESFSFLKEHKHIFNQTNLISNFTINNEDHHSIKKSESKTLKKNVNE
jgi:hypothetical protein